MALTVKKTLPAGGTRLGFSLWGTWTFAQNWIVDQRVELTDWLADPATFIHTHTQIGQSKLPTYPNKCTDVKKTTILLRVTLFSSFLRLLSTVGALQRFGQKRVLEYKKPPTIWQGSTCFKPRHKNNSFLWATKGWLNSTYVVNKAQASNVVHVRNALGTKLTLDLI